MEDSSVDVCSLDRKDILARLDLKLLSSFDIGRLRFILKNILQKKHPTHECLSQLSQER